MATSAQASMATIEQFINRVGRVKTAETAYTEPGSQGGETDHPVKNVDDRCEPAKEGERSSENTSDVKEDQGAPGVNSQPEATAKSGLDLAASLVKTRAKTASTNPFTQGVKKPATNKPAPAVKKAEGGAVQSEGSAPDDAEESPLDPQPTGKTPDIETSSAKGGKEDPGSDHPARTDNDSLDGHKYAADSDPVKIASDLKSIGDNLLAKLSWVSEQLGNPKQAADVQRVASQQGGQPRQQTKQASAPLLDPAIQMQLGWEMAGLINGTMDKQAADLMVQNELEGIIKQASVDAFNTANFLHNFFTSVNAAQKQAEGEMPPDPAAMGGDPMGGMGGDPSGGMGGMDGGGGDPMGGGGGEDAMMSALGGGQSADPTMGGDPTGGMGGGEGGGGEGGDITPEQLAQILDVLGISEEELQQAVADESGGGDAGGAGDPLAAAGGMGGGGMGGGMGGGEEKPAFDRRRGTTKQGAAKPGNHLKEAAAVITELIQRSRRK